MPGNESPAERRENAAAGIVLTSWETTSNPSRAAYARISVSGSVLIPRSKVGDARVVDHGLLAANPDHDMFVETMIGQESWPTHCTFVPVPAARPRSRWTTGLAAALAFSRHSFQQSSAPRRTRTFNPLIKSQRLSKCS